MSILAQRVAEAADLVTVALDALLPRADGPEQRLTEAMRYAALGPGKRLRPFLVVETAALFKAKREQALMVGAAAEMNVAAASAPQPTLSLNAASETPPLPLYEGTP